MSQPTLTLNPQFKIGAVARQTGVSVHTLRKWEERYRAVDPERTPGGGRLYSQTDLDRLKLIKKLADRGMSLGGLATMSLSELREAWSADNAVPEPRVEAAHSVGVVCIGPTVGALLARSTLPRNVALLTAAAAIEDLAMTTAPSDSVLVMEVSVVDSNTAKAVRETASRLNINHCIVVYHFAPNAELLALQAERIAHLRAPATAASIATQAAALANVGGGRPRVEAGTSEPPPPRFTERQIAEIAAVAPKVACECPHHLADLIAALSAFEKYSAQCESRNSEDAALHHYLWRCAGQARAVFEDAIEYVAKVEGLELPQSGGLAD